jgi:long-subunit fatty acid transport protein
MLWFFYCVSISWRRIFTNIGGVLKIPFSADLKREKTLNYSIDFPDAPDFNIDESTSTDEDQELDMPMSYGIGVAYRFSDQLTASFDIYRTKWDNSC